MASVNPFRSFAVIGIVTAGALLIAGWLFQRMMTGNLFLLAFPFETPPTWGELRDSEESARIWRWPACSALVILGLLAGWMVTHRPQMTTLSFRSPAVWVVVAAAIADFVTTLWFFHFRSIELEVHPALRLFGYAFGRTAGPLLGKGLQLAGILLLSQLLPRFRGLLLYGSALLMMLAAAHNVLSQ